jgi:signal transduction histidine kinase
VPPAETTHRFEASPSPREEPNYLRIWLRAYLWLTVATSAYLFGLFLVRRSFASILIAIVLAGAAMIIRWGVSLAARERYQAALAVFCFSNWGVVLLIATRGEVALTAGLPMLIMPVVIAVPYTTPRALYRLSGVGLLICAVAATVAALGPFMPSSISDNDLSKIMVPIVVTTTAMLLFGIGQVGSRLRASLREIRAANAALRESERSLEKKVEERTAELAAKNVELSEIEAIARTVNSTLDLDEVLTATRSALKRHFSFDQIAVFLLSEDRQHLVVDRMEGIVLSQEVRARMEGEGFPMSEENSLVVSAVRNNEPRWIEDLRPEAVELMTPTDRWVYEANPMRAILVCPLEIEGATIGAIAFTDSRPWAPKTDDASDGGEHQAAIRENVARVQRYVAAIASAIRNARLYEATKAARAEAIDASRAKSQFLANMSHELRTPLNAIIGYTEMLQEEAADSGQQQLLADLGRIRESSRYLLELINGVLDLAKIEAGRMDVFVETFDVRGLLDEIAGTVRPLVDKRGNTLEVGIEDGLGTMTSDVTKVRQMLLNLLSNASKFTEEGTIRLSAKRAREDGREWLDFVVADTGIGMSAEQSEKVFDAFAQADSSTTRRYGGTGLGLAITRQFCEMLGGSISLRTRPAMGTTFTIRLPSEVAAAPAATVAGS